MDVLREKLNSQMYPRQASFLARSNLKHLPIEERKKILARIKAKYPNTVPVIMCPGRDVVLNKTKFVIPETVKVGTLILHAREQIQSLLPHESIFVFVQESVIPSISTSMAELYARYKDVDDGFLYVHVTKENTFG